PRDPRSFHTRRSSDLAAEAARDAARDEVTAWLHADAAALAELARRIGEARAHHAAAVGAEAEADDNAKAAQPAWRDVLSQARDRSEEHTSELQSRENL